jgi:hypothetical protein
MVTKLVKGIKTVFRIINTRFRVRIVTFLPETVSWSSRFATMSTRSGMITELNKIRTKGAKYSGRKLFNTLLFSTSV